MYVTVQQVLGLTEESLKDFLCLRIPEGLYLDYKAALSGPSDKEAKRQFLKDITALANAAGGHILLGVREPSEGLSVDDQMVGLDEGEALSQDLERLASTSVDPRIPGFRIKHVPLAGGKSCIVIHIPPSLSRPHMVHHTGHRTFYVRHSESSFPMTTHEVREALLTSASAETRARLQVERRLSEVRESLGDHQPAFFIQAIPLISLESSWSILDAAYENVLRSSVRRECYNHSYRLVSTIAPRPTIDGLIGKDQREQPTWETEAHRTGYVSVCYRDIKREIVRNIDRYVVHTGYCDLFRSYCQLLKELWDISTTDVPYLVSCAYLNAQGTCLWTESQRSSFSDPYEKKDIIWPEHIRPTGEDPMEIAEALCLELCNAFGFREVVK